MSFRRTFKFGLIGFAFAALLGGAVLKSHAHAGWGHDRKAAIMKRVVTAHIDELLDDAKVNDAQRQTVNAARDRVFAAFEGQSQNRRSHMDQALQLFESDRIDTNQLNALRTQREAEGKQLADVITQALVDVHDVLNPQQRKVFADHIRSFRGAHGE